MLIVCPQCGFSRNVANDRLKGRYVTATCPKCHCQFKVFSDGHVNILGGKDGAEEDKRQEAVRAYEREQRRLEEEAPIDYEADDVSGEAAEPVRGVPWDYAPSVYGWFQAFQMTVMAVLVAPSSFFKRLNPEQPVFRALLFFLIICVFQIVIERLWTEAFVNFFSSTSVSDPQMKTLLELLTPKTDIILTVLLRAALSILQLYIFGFLMYLALRLVAPAAASFSVIFQILAYSSAPSLLCIIPAVGSLAGFVWGICCIAIGLRVAFDLDWPKVFFIFLPPLLIIFSLLSQAFKAFGQ